MSNRWFIELTAALVLSLDQASAQKTNSKPASVAIGLEGQRMVVLPGDKFEAAPVGEKSKLILRIQDVFPHGNAHRYYLRYFGFVPGEYDLIQFLRTADGNAPTNLPPVKVTIHGILPEDHDGMLIEDNDSGLNLPGSYTAWLRGLGIVWLLVAWPSRGGHRAGTRRATPPTRGTGCCRHTRHRGARPAGTHDFLLLAGTAWSA